MKKTLVKFEHCKIVFVKVDMSVTRNIWKRSLIQTLRHCLSLISVWKKYWDPKEQSTRQHPVNISLPKN